MMIKREIGEKGQVVIPKDIRKHLGLGIGTGVTFEVKNDEIIMKKEENSVDIVEDFFNTPKIKKKVSTKELKKIYEEQYG
ncbi:AbrB/MazE/SpoVT family DNA-binding domain-containing protein [Candidatus Pacearchaeota archaeon]|nr:AbrB/MazE/SpoVT family DNA-binding domain-containing protein [Candidatus Pacearchaeota archaeon]